MHLKTEIKILVIINSKFGYDGISNVVTNYYHYQDKSKVKMDLLTINNIPKKFKKEIEHYKNQHFIVSERNRNPISYIIKVQRIIKDNNYDIVYIHGNSATMAIDLLGAKIGNCSVRVAHSHNTRCNHQKINRILMPVFTRLYTDCCACSIEAGRFLFGKKECHIVNNGIYIPKYSFDKEKRNKIRKQCGINHEIVIGHVGRFSYQKNQEFLIDILKEMVKRGKDTILLLVGNGELEEQIRKHAREAKMENRIIFYGTTDYVEEVFQAMDCFVFPSRFEGLGNVAIEAQATGLNCVASDHVPFKIKISNKTCFLSLDLSIKEWVDTIEQCIVTVEEREENRDFVKYSLCKAGYDIEKNCKDMLIYYQQIARRNK